MAAAPITDTEFFATVDGRDFTTASSFAVINPATGAAFAEAPAVTPEQLDAIFNSAQRAYATWSIDEEARRRAMREAADVLERHSGDLAPILTAEQGKPFKEAEREISGSAVWLRYYADLELPREVVQDDADGYAEVFRRPLGVVAAITPWNFPIVLAMWKIAPALRAGNTLVVKPSPYTPLTTLALGRVLRGVLPPGVLNVISGPDPLGASMTAHPVPRKISFTGSTPTGKKVAQSAAVDLKRLTLELGGNDPAVVLGDVNVSDIARSLFWSAFGNNGQICLAVKRVYAHESIHDELVEALADIARNVKIGEGTDHDVQLGPLNNKQQLDIVSMLVTDALAHGATASAGGSALQRPGYFFSPTILSNISDGVRIVDEEQFGPALPIMKFTDEADVIARANRGNYGLTASVWSSDVEHALAIASSIDTGQVSVNNHGAGVRPHLPFGGHKWSGIGVENGPWGLYGFTELQVITSPPRRPS
jgi:acyl-CoA reductase-like NAD-dependent aldehyde dehydrogenase